MRVLVVDDEPAVRGVIEQTMTRSGCDVYTATDGFDALKKLALGRFDLVVTDVVMPEMDGIKLIAHIRELYPDLKVIAISGGGGIRSAAPGCLNRAEEAGASRTLLKPFNPSLLNSMADELLGRTPSGR
jgi:CheY-like chemotaxis protein